MDAIMQVLSIFFCEWLAFEATPAQANAFLDDLALTVIYDYDGDVPSRFTFKQEHAAYMAATGTRIEKWMDAQGIKDEVHIKKARKTREEKTRQYRRSSMEGYSRKRVGGTKRGCPCCTGLTFREAERIMLGDDDMDACTMGVYEHEELHELMFTL